MIQKLKGYKTYLTAMMLAAVAGLHYLGYLNDNLAKTLEMVIASGSIASLRAALTNSVATK